MKIKIFYLVLFFISVSLDYSYAQIASYVHLAALGSDGIAPALAPDSEDMLEEFKDLILKNYPFKQKSADIFALNEEQQNNAEDALSNAYAISGKDDLFLFGIFGAWKEDKFVSTYNNKISPDYIYNMALYFPAQTELFVIISPAEYPFPADIFGEQISEFSGGKIIAVLSNSPNQDYDDVISAVTDALDDMADSPEDYADAHGEIRFSSWLNKFKQLLVEEEVSSRFYKLSDGPDYIINTIIH